MNERETEAPPLAHDGGPSTIVGLGAAARMLPRFAARSGILLIDARIHAQHPRLASHARRVCVVDPELDSPDGVLRRICAEVGAGDDAGPTLESATTMARITHTTIVGVGGGAVLDLAKLLRMRLLSASTFRAVTHTARSFGVAMIPNTWGRGVPTLVLIPTTLGTGSEASAVACLTADDADGSRRLIAGNLMKAQRVVLDATLTRSLDAHAVREGAAEILLRIIGSYVGDVPRPVPDAAAEELVGRVVGLAERGNRHGYDDETREALAVASGETHTGWALVGRSPYGAKHWYLANELSSASGQRKVPTTFRLLPAIWQRIVDGDTRLGDIARLLRLWRVIAAALDLPGDPVQGVVEWSRRWGVAAPSVSARLAVGAARACFEAWGGDRPALGGLAESDIRAIYLTAHARASTPENRQRTGEEVSGW